VRYALPLCVFAAVLAAGALAQLRARRWVLPLMVLALAQPLYGAVRLTGIAAEADTRVEARRWLEAHVPEGATCCNFGGWFGDVPLATYEDLWWRIWNFERAYPRANIDAALDFLAAHRPAAPYYSYAVTAGNQRLEPGSVETIDNHDCAYVVLHRHRLSYSAVDSAFAARLAAHAERLAHFAPAGLAQAAPVYDPIDAYYLPIGDFGALRQAGPEVEIWKWKDVAPEVRDTQRAFAQAYAVGAFVRLAQNRLEDCHLMTRRALELDPDNAEALFAQALIFQQRGDTRAAVERLRRVLALDPEHAGAYYNLGTIYQGASRLAQALDARERFVRLRPRYAEAYYSLGVLYYQLGRYEEALRSSREGLALEDSPGFRYNMALAYAGAGRRDEAIAVLVELLARTPDDANAHFLLGNIYAEAGQRREAAEHYGQMLALDPAHVRAAAVRHTLDSYNR
ncbi:MAG: tetratricopeptide repeat protein, partial [Candidatus Latescibacteria bacterium]|jgi:tetratricopeptide (TPR) repeat protein|nr:tetratricopeptide repeat protein [Candidatus Latescibacterota bacterium]